MSIIKTDQEKQDKVYITHLNPLAKTPKYATIGSSGLDLHASIETDIEILSGKTILINTGIAIALPIGYEAQIRSRSGLALNHNIIVLNSPGTIDSDYRGEIKIILHNCGEKSYIVKCYDRIAQMVFAKVDQLQMVNVESLDITDRNSDGFGSTGY